MKKSRVEFLVNQSIKLVHCSLLAADSADYCLLVLSSFCPNYVSVHENGLKTDYHLPPRIAKYSALSPDSSAPLRGWLDASSPLALVGSELYVGVPGGPTAEQVS